MGRGGGRVVSALAYCLDDLSSKKRPGLAQVKISSN